MAHNQRQQSAAYDIPLIEGRRAVNAGRRGSGAASCFVGLARGTPIPFGWAVLAAPSPPAPSRPPRAPLARYPLASERLLASGLEAQVLAEKRDHMVLKTIGHLARVSTGVDLETVGDAVFVQDLVQLTTIGPQPILVAHVD
jgi:hypothetical protein